TLTIRVAAFLKPAPSGPIGSTRRLPIWLERDLAPFPTIRLRGQVTPENPIVKYFEFRRELRKVRVYRDWLLRCIRARLGVARCDGGNTCTCDTSRTLCSSYACCSRASRASCAS